MTQLIYQYGYLQVLDFLTTVAFLLHGVQEGNPMVRMAMHFTSNPLAGLVLVKLAAVLLGAMCWYFGRERLLKRVNLLFALVVAWNLIALIMASPIPA